MEKNEFDDNIETEYLKRLDKSKKNKKLLIL